MIDNNNSLSVEELALNRLYTNKIIPLSLYDQIQENLTLGNKPKSSNNCKNITNIKYNFNLVNTNINLQKTTTRLIKAWKAHHKPFSILLYGQSGSGKSFYAQYLAQQLGLKFLKKKASDLVDKLVGETEKNIRDAFQEAADNNALLCIDEADSFLFDRSKANQDHQLSKVNEILVQMESFQYPFVCTTNLIDSIDSACFRRFIFKIKFDYLDKSKVIECTKFFFKKRFTKMKEFSYLCAGDFYTIKRKLDILCDKVSKSDIEEALQEEIELKPDYKQNANKNHIGFNNN